jgi:hypothetical protein
MTYFCLCPSGELGTVDAWQSAYSMPRHSPYPVVLTAYEKAALEAIARKYTSEYFQVVRAKAILLAATGLRNDQIAQRVSLPRQSISKWRKRFFEERLDGLDNLPRSGRPPVFPP